MRNEEKKASIYALVTMFGKWRKCEVKPYGTPLERYEKDQTLWVESGDDLYAMSHYREPFCVLTRESWLQSGRDEIIDDICRTGKSISR